MIANILSLFTLTQGVLVTETNYEYTTLTVYAPRPTGYEDDLSNSTSGVNGTFPNGTYANGTYPNGTYPNGTFANGTAHNVTLGNLTNYANSTALTSEIYTAISTYETSPEAPQYSEVPLTSETPAPVPETTSEPPAPAPETSSEVLAPAPETTTEVPAPETTEAPAPETTEAPAPETTYEAPQTTEQPAVTATEEPTQTTEETQPTESGTQDNSQQLDSFAQDIIDYHNRVRAEHSAPALTWNQDLANYAQNYLDGSQCNFAHSGGPYGENIALGYSPHEAMVAWYDEYQQYDYASGQFSSSTGHFTQMVWKDTTEVGCATINCDGWGPYLACEYTPRGNIIGEFTSNVLAN